MTRPVRPIEQRAEKEAAAEPAANAGNMDTTGAQPEAPQEPKSDWVLSPAAPNISQPPGREDPLARYRRERALPDDPFGDGRKPVPTRSYRDKIMLNPNPAARFTERVTPQPEGGPAPRFRARLSLPQAMAAAASVALAAGVGVGLAAAWLFTSTATAPQTLVVQTPAAGGGIAALPPLPAAPAAPAPAAQTTVITKKPVPIATLHVADVTGETNSYIPLALQAEPGGLTGDIMLRISGIPDDAYLTSGRKEEDKIWSLSRDEIRDVKLVVPKSNQPQFDLAVAAVEPKTGELAAPVKTMTVALSNVLVLPASAPPPQQQASAPQMNAPLNPVTAAPAAIPPPDSVKLALQTAETTPEAQQLVLDGDEALRNGDIKAARSAYEKAWSKGAADGAFGLARSYDPVALASLDLTKAKPDKVRAIAWYERAATAGNADAAAAIVRLKLKP